MVSFVDGIRPGSASLSDSSAYRTRKPSPPPNIGKKKHKVRVKIIRPNDSDDDDDDTPPPPPPPGPPPPELYPPTCTPINSLPASFTLPKLWAPWCGKWITISSLQFIFRQKFASFGISTSNWIYIIVYCYQQWKKSFLQLLLCPFSVLLRRLEKFFSSPDTYARWKYASALRKVVLKKVTRVTESHFHSITLENFFKEL